MTSILLYLLKISISLSVLYLFYYIALRRLTFYNWNRWYLLLYSVLTFIIPFINVYPVLEKNNWSRYDVLDYIPVVGAQPDGSIREASIPWSYHDLALIFIIAGIAVMLGRLVIQQLSFWRIRRASKLIIDGMVKVYQVDKDIIPFSYGNSIFVNQHQHSQEELKEIIRHEFIHVKQKHTLDILWAEWLCILNWYNPFAWLLRQSIRQNLEFIADNKVLQNGIDKREYQYLLLKVIGVTHFSIAPQFNFSSLKKRIAMMNKMKSGKVHLIKFLFMLPLVAILLLAFRNQQQDEPLQVIKVIAFPNTDTVPTPAQRSSRHAKPKMPEGVSSIDIDNNMATVNRKNGQTEKYNLDKPGEKAAFEKKYGKIPPPPAPEEAPSPASPPASPVPSEAPTPGLPPSPPVPPQPPIKKRANAKGYVITIADNQGECVVIVKDKDHKIVKALALSEWNANEEENTSKYGEIPPPPPPPKRIPPIDPVKGKGIKENLDPVSPAVSAPSIDNGIIIAPSPGSFYAKPFSKPNKPEPPVIRWSEVSSDPDLLVIIDGVQQPPGENALNKLDPNDIERIDVLKGESAKAVYGEKGKSGVVSITTNKYAQRKNESDKIRLNGNVQLGRMDNFNGLFIIDGKEYDKKGFTALNLEAVNIESVNVLKGESAAKAYGDKGRDGIIEIITIKEKKTTAPKG